MIFVVGEDDKGNVIVKISSNIGKTDEEIAILDEGQYTVFQELAKAIVRMDIKISNHQYISFQGIKEEYMECLNMLQCHCEETLADMEEMMEMETGINEERRPLGTYQRKSHIKIKNQIQQQAKSALKYKRYELRIYDRMGERRTANTTGRSISDRQNIFEKTSAKT